MKAKTRKSTKAITDVPIKLKSQKNTGTYKIKIPKKIKIMETSEALHSEGENRTSTNPVISNSNSTSRQNLILAKSNNVKEDFLKIILAYLRGNRQRRRQCPLQVP